MPVLQKPIMKVNHFLLALLFSNEIFVLKRNDLQIIWQHYLQDIFDIEVPITNEKPKYYQVNDNNTLISNVTHTYHLEITELVPQTNYSLQYNDETVPSHQFSLHQVYMTTSDTPPISSPIYNVQPTSHTSKPRFSLHYHTLQKISNS